MGMRLSASTGVHRSWSLNGHVVVGVYRGAWSLESKWACGCRCLQGCIVAGVYRGVVTKQWNMPQLTLPGSRQCDMVGLYFGVRTVRYGRNLFWGPDSEIYMVGISFGSG